MSAFAKATARQSSLSTYDASADWNKGITLPLEHPIMFPFLRRCLHALQALEARGLSKAALWLQPVSFAFDPALRPPPVEQVLIPLKGHLNFAVRNFWRQGDS